jgi:hypothetical protein
MTDEEALQSTIQLLHSAPGRSPHQADWTTQDVVTELTELGEYLVSAGALDPAYLY